MRSERLWNAPKAGETTPRDAAYSVGYVPLQSGDGMRWGCYGMAAAWIEVLAHLQCGVALHSSLQRPTHRPCAHSAAIQSVAPAKFGFAAGGCAALRILAIPVCSKFRAGWAGSSNKDSCFYNYSANPATSLLSHRVHKGPQLCKRVGPSDWFSIRGSLSACALTAC